MKKFIAYEPVAYEPNRYPCVLNFHCSEELHSYLKSMANKERCSINLVARRLLEDALQAMNRASARQMNKELNTEYHLDRRKNSAQNPPT
jgi:hypothetical protein